jgi:hypothetical protein
MRPVFELRWIVFFAIVSIPLFEVSWCALAESDAPSSRRRRQRPIIAGLWTDVDGPSMALRMSRPRLKTADFRTARTPEKVVDPWYLTPEHQAWAADVISRAGGRCEAIDNGVRCEKAQPQHRMYADHIKEKRDGGDLLDRKNGRCLCGSHHTRKTLTARAHRMAAMPQAQG